MEFTMERWHSAVGQRFSCRKYKSAPPPEDVAHMKKKAEELSVRGMRIVIAHDKRIFSPIFLGAGRIKGTDCFAAFVIKGDDMRSVGYLGEAFLLECTALGLGSCWLGMFNKRIASSGIGLEEDETIVCIAAIGTADEKYKARPRKGLDKLTGLDQQTLLNLPEWQRFALECARLAPSAANSEPWRFRVDGDKIKIRSTGNNFGFGMVDIGIAMLHMELGAAHGGVSGEWSTDGADALFTPVYE